MLRQVVLQNEIFNCDIVVNLKKKNKGKSQKNDLRVSSDVNCRVFWFCGMESKKLIDLSTYIL